jgi:hypothetical protein
VPGEAAEVEVWILGSGGGPSAEAAGARGLRFAANYHVSPATVRTRHRLRPTEADELLITTITHDHLDRVRSYELLADEWRRRGHSEHRGR